MKSSLQDSIKAFERKQRILFILLLIFLTGLSVIYTYLYRSGQAAESAKLISRMIHIQDLRETILTLQSARLEHFRVIRFVSTDPQKSFTLPELADLIPNASPLNSLIYHTIRIPVEIPGQGQAEIFFEFNRLAYTPWAILFSLIISLIALPQTHFMKRQITDQYEKDLELDRQTSRLEIANIVRHNIRTPLSALMRLSQTVPFRDEHEAEVFQSVITQIRALISKLDTKSPMAEKEKFSNGSLLETLQMAVHEIRIGIPAKIHFDFSYDDSLPSILAPFAHAEMRSIIANIVTNSVEALNGDGQIYLTVKDLGHSVFIEVTDNGPGIPTDILNSVTKKGFTFGKSNGTGLGLFHAQNYLHEWDGEIRVYSPPNKGTIVEMRLPIHSRHSWYTSRVKFTPDSTLVIVDDQASIHALWKMKLAEVGFSGKVLSFFNVPDFRNGIKDFPPDKTLIFMDYDLHNDDVTGLDLLQEVSSHTHRYLVTGHFDDPKILESCTHLQLSLIPKTTLHELPLVLG